MPAKQSPYKKGDRVELVSTDDPYTRLRTGDRGTVQDCEPVQSAERGSQEWQVFVQWDNGSNLTMLVPHDRIKIISESVGATE